MRVVDAVVLQQHSLYSRWNSSNRHLHLCAGRGQVIVLIVPHHDSGFAIRFGCDGVDIGRLGNALAQDVIKRNPTGAAGLHAISGHQGGHPEHIQHRLVHTIRHQSAKSFKIILALKFERPRQHSQQVDLVPVLEFE